MKFIKMDYIWGHRITVTTFKRIEIIQIKFSDHYGIKLEIATESYLENSPVLGN